MPIDEQMGTTSGSGCSTSPAPGPGTTSSCRCTARRARSRRADAGRAHQRRAAGPRAGRRAARTTGPRRRRRRRQAPPPGADPRRPARTARHRATWRRSASGAAERDAGAGRRGPSPHGGRHRARRPTAGPTPSADRPRAGEAAPRPRPAAVAEGPLRHRRRPGRARRAADRRPRHRRRPRRRGRRAGAAEGVAGRDDDIARAGPRRARLADVVRGRGAGPHWREVYVGAPRSAGRLLEGYVDLLYRARRRPGRRRLQDRPATADAELDAAGRGLPAQGASYALAVGRRHGRAGGAVVFVFLTPDGCRGAGPPRPRGRRRGGRSLAAGGHHDPHREAPATVACRAPCPVRPSPRRWPASSPSCPAAARPGPARSRWPRPSADAIAAGPHLVVQAGTGTGKTLGYLVPAILSRQARSSWPPPPRRCRTSWPARTCRSSAEHLDRPVHVRRAEGPVELPLPSSGLAEVARPRRRRQPASMRSTGWPSGPTPSELTALVAWGAETADRRPRRADFEPSRARRGRAVSVGVRASAPARPAARRARRASPRRPGPRPRRPTSSSSTPHLYGTPPGPRRRVLPEHDVVVFDEAHQLEDIISATAGVELGAGRFTAAGPGAAGHPRRSRRPRSPGDGRRRPARRRAGRPPRRAPHGPAAADLAGALAAVAVAGSRPRRRPCATSPRRAGDDVTNRAVRARQAATALLDDLDAVAAPGDADVLWVEGPEHARSLRVAPVDVAALLAERLWARRTAVLTSATHPARLRPPPRPAAAAASTCSTSAARSTTRPTPSSTAPPTCPTPAPPATRPALHDELGALIDAAGGRTLALFTSWRAMQPRPRRCAAGCRTRCSPRATCPSPRSSSAFTATRRRACSPPWASGRASTCPARRCRCVVDRPAAVPPPRRPAAPGPPRAGRAGARSRAVDLPRAATLLAQGAGRLIRTATDRGVVAVLDPRLATAGYRWDIVARPAPDAPHPRPRRGRGVPRATCDRPPSRLSSRGARAPWARRCQSLSTLTNSSRKAPSGSCSRTRGADLP